MAETKKLLRSRKVNSLLWMTEKGADKLWGLIKEKMYKRPTPGDKILIYWKDYDEPDAGYLFELPECDSYTDEFDLYYHVAKPNVYDGKDAPNPEWGHLIDLIINKQCKKITRA